MSLRKWKEPDNPQGVHAFFWDQKNLIGGPSLHREYPKAIAHKAAYPISTYCLDLRLRVYRVITFRMVPAPFLENQI